MSDLGNEEQQNPVSQNQEVTLEEFTAQLGTLKQKAFMQIIYGILWWGASAVAMFFALEATGSTVYYFGGALGSLFHWYRAFRIHQVIRSVGIKQLSPIETIAILGATVLVIASSVLIVPEYFRVDSPGIGTCWAKATEGYAPVACWGSNAEFKTNFIADSMEQCPAESAHYFDPGAYESRYTCLVDN